MTQMTELGLVSRGRGEERRERGERGGNGREEGRRMGEGGGGREARRGGREGKGRGGGMGGYGVQGLCIAVVLYVRVACLFC